MSGRSAIGGKILCYIEGLSNQVYSYVNICNLVRVLGGFLYGEEGFCKEKKKGEVFCQGRVAGAWVSSPLDERRRKKASRVS